jgi:hypothetical protein
VALLLAALRRQWPLVLLAVIISPTVGYFLATEYGDVTATAHLTLALQELPLTSQQVYTTPNPDVASEILKSVAVLQPVIEKHGLPSIHELAANLKVTPNKNTATINVDLLLDDSRKAVDALNDLGEDFAKAITERRKSKLTTDAAYVSELKLKALSDLSAARSELVKLQESQRLNGKNDVQKSAELQSLLNRQAQLATSVEQADRVQSRIQRDQKLLAEDAATVRLAIFRELLDGRRRQLQNFGRGLTESARIKALKIEIEKELAKLDDELVRISAASEGAEAQNAAVASGESDISMAGNAVPTESPGTEAISPSLVKSADAKEVTTPVVPAAKEDLVRQEDLLKVWIEKVSAVGKETLGDLDPSSAAEIQAAAGKLAAIANEKRRLQLQIEDNNVDREYFLAKAKEMELEIKRSAAAQLNLSSARAMELESDVEDKEEKYGRLSQHLDQIHQIRDCQMSEYIVSSKARVNPFLDYKSDKKKLFAFAFLGTGLVLLAPSVLVELLRLRPTPVNAVSRRWNLPVLGMQSSSRNPAKGPKDLAIKSQTELRLMALRIQQSLFRPNGRVVLFSGLDHEESPMVLIRSLANCFAQREETVLMIQTLPGQLESLTKHSSENVAHRSGRPGVAEFLAGKYDTARPLIIETGIKGVDFLPGGETITASEFMASSRLTALIEQLREQYSMILLCGPSTLHPADLQMLAARADGIVFTVNRKSLQTVHGEEVIGDLIELGAPILGFAEQPVLAKKAFPALNDALAEVPSSTAISA